MGLEDYARPSLTTDIVLFRIKDLTSKSPRKYAEKDLQVLLVKRENEPQKGVWSLPGGFVEIDEEIFDNVKRKLKEKTGVEGNFYIEQLYTWGDIDRDSRGRVISVSFMGLCNEDTYTEKNVGRVTGWFSVKEIFQGKFGDLAFDHKKIICYAMERLKGKIEYTDIAFNLLPDLFTLRECQNVYELILGKSIDNFRRKIGSYVEPTDKMLEGMQFNPAKLYKVNKNREGKF